MVPGTTVDLRIKILSERVKPGWVSILIEVPFVLLELKLCINLFLFIVPPLLLVTNNPTAAKASSPSSPTSSSILSVITGVAHPFTSIPS